MQAAVAVLNTPVPTFLEKIGTQFRAVFGPKKFHLAEDSPAERRQAHAIDVLRCGEHPLKDKALRCALRSDCQNVRWHAAVALGAQDRGVQAVIRKLPKSAFQDRIRGCLNHLSPETDKFLVEVDSALILGVLKKIVQETTIPKDLERIGDLFAERINTGHKKEVGVLIDYLKLSSSIGKGLPQHFSTIVDRVCLRAFSQVLELLPNELDDLAAAIKKANFSEERVRDATGIVANLRKAQEETASQE